jgi:glycosyltransferase involved in cell wall biosynthesis
MLDSIAIDFVGTNLGSGSRSYNLNFCNELSFFQLKKNIKIFICKNYYSHLNYSIKKNRKIEIILKPNFLSIGIIRLLWIQFILPFELKYLGIKKLYSSLNFSPVIAKFLGIKVVLCCHSNLPWVYFNLMPGNLVRNFFVKMLMELSIYYCDILIVNSYYAKKELINILRLNKKKIYVVYLGISRIFFSKKNKKIHNFNYKKKYILSVISCVRYHNIINILKAFNLLNNDLNIRLILVLQVLDKSYFLDIIRFIENNSLKNKITILTNLTFDKLPELYRKAELYVFTSYCEVFGLTSLEAMSQKTPVLISNRSALPEINGKAAMYFNPDNVEEIYKQFKKVLLNKKLQFNLIQNGNKIFKKYNNKKNIQKTLNIIDSLK